MSTRFYRKQHSLKVDGVGVQSSSHLPSMRKTEVWSLTLQTEKKKYMETAGFTDCQSVALSSSRAQEEESVCVASPVLEGSIVMT